MVKPASAVTFDSGCGCDQLINGSPEWSFSAQLPLPLHLLMPLARMQATPGSSNRDAAGHESVTGSGDRRILGLLANDG
jgi:hypothetical protein